MTNYAKRILQEFCKTELRLEEAKCDILQFILSENIRSGEYVGNMYVLRKIDFYNFMIFEEYIDRNEVYISRYNLSVFTKEELLEFIHHQDMGPTL